MTEPVAQPEQQPWSPWATAGIGILISVVYVAAQTVVVLGFMAAALFENPNADLEKLTNELVNDGFLVSVATLVSGVICLPLVLLAAKFRQRFTIAEYFDLKAVPAGTLWAWIAVMGGAILISDLFVVFVLGKPLVPEVMQDYYRTARFPIVLWAAMIIAAPLMEEFFFRGFLFKGWQNSALGPWGTIVLTALLWSIIHVQYDLLGIAAVFAGGLLLGYARWRTGSLITSLILHVVWNIVATVETALLSS
jgi:membrane protease YdiL (CAAX protease family)